MQCKPCLLLASLVIGLMTLAPAAMAGNNWDGGSDPADTNTHVATNWSGDALPDYNALLEFGSQSDCGATLQWDYKPDEFGFETGEAFGIRFGGPTSPAPGPDALGYTFNGTEPIRLNGLYGGILNYSANKQTFEQPIWLTQATAKYLYTRAGEVEFKDGIVFQGITSGQNRAYITALLPGSVVTIGDMGTDGSGIHAPYFWGEGTIDVNGVLSGTVTPWIQNWSDGVPASGLVSFNGHNTYTGITNLAHGTLRISHDNALGSAASTANRTVIGTGGTSRACLELTGDITVSESLTVLGSAAYIDNTFARIRNVSGNNTINGPITLAASGNCYTFQSAGTAPGDKFTIASNLTPASGFRLIGLTGEGDGEVSGVIAGYGILKSGGGTWTLTAANTAGPGYGVSIQGGTLALSGDGSLQDTPWIEVMTADAVFDVSSVTGGSYAIGGGLATQRLHGGGTVVGNVSIANGSTVEAQLSAVREFTFDGDLSLDSGANVTWDLGALADDATGTAGIDFDQIVIKGGDLDLGGSQLTLNFGLLAEADRPTADPPNAFWSGQRAWKIIDVDADNGGTNSGETNFGGIVFSGEAPLIGFTTRVGTGIDLGDIFLIVNASTAPIPGDANGDNKVDDADAKVLAAHWGASGVGIGWDKGDFNGDGKVDARDAAILAANWLYGVGEGTTGASVPEPGTMTLLLIAGSLIACLRRRRTA